LNISCNSILSNTLSNTSSASLSSENLLKLPKENYFKEIDLKDFIIKDKLKKERHSYFNDKLYVIGLSNSSDSFIQQKDSLINSRELIKLNNSICCENSFIDIINNDKNAYYKNNNSLKNNEIENSIYKRILEKEKN
jgi:hypothetical protein